MIRRRSTRAQGKRETNRLNKREQGIMYAESHEIM